MLLSSMKSHLLHMIQRPHGVFMCLFFILLCVPVLHISDATKSDTENRMLATRPTLFVDGTINNKFGTEFDAWFNDRFFGRTALVALNDTLAHSGGDSGNDMVLIEEDNWLFLRDGLSGYTNYKQFSDTEMQKMSKYLVDINNWCKQHNKKFVFVIAPDKNKIYGEHISVVNKFRPDEQSSTAQFRQYLLEHTDVTMLYLRDILLAHKPDGLLYYKNDTHWNSYSAYLGYLQIMDFLKHQPIQPVSYQTEHRCIGDLTRMMTSIPQDCDSIYTKPIITNNAVCTPYRDMEDLHCTNNQGQGRIFVLRDSFANAMSPFLNATYNMTDYKWRYNLQKSDLKYIQDSNVDTVMLIMVERKLSMNQLLNLSFPKE